MFDDQNISKYKFLCYKDVKFDRLTLRKGIQEKANFQTQEAWEWVFVNVCITIKTKRLMQWESHRQIGSITEHSFLLNTKNIGREAEETPTKIRFQYNHILNKSKSA